MSRQLRAFSLVPPGRWSVAKSAAQVPRAGGKGELCRVPPKPEEFRSREAGAKGGAGQPQPRRICPKGKWSALVALVAGVMPLASSLPGSGGRGARGHGGLQPARSCCRGMGGPGTAPGAAAEPTAAAWAATGGLSPTASPSALKHRRDAAGPQLRTPLEPVLLLKDTGSSFATGRSLSSLRGRGCVGLWAKIHGTERKPLLGPGLGFAGLTSPFQRYFLLLLGRFCSLCCWSVGSGSCSLLQTPEGTRSPRSERWPGWAFAFFPALGNCDLCGGVYICLFAYAERGRRAATELNLEEMDNLV